MSRVQTQDLLRTDGTITSYTKCAYLSVQYISFPTTYTSRHTTTTHVTGTTRPLPATTTTTTTRPRPRMDATGTAGEEHGLETGVSRASLVCFFFMFFLTILIYLYLSETIHPQSTSTRPSPTTHDTAIHDTTNHPHRLPRHHDTHHPSTTRDTTTPQHQPTKPATSSSPNYP